MSELEFKYGSSNFKDVPCLWKQYDRNLQVVQKAWMYFSQRPSIKERQGAIHGPNQPNSLETWLPQVHCSINSFHKQIFFLPYRPRSARPACLTMFFPNSHLAQTLKLAAFDMSIKANDLSHFPGLRWKVQFCLLQNCASGLSSCIQSYSSYD